MSSHGGGQRKSQGGGRYDSRRERGVVRSPLPGERGGGRQGRSGHSPLPEERGHGGQGRSGSESPYHQERIMDYCSPGSSSAGTIREFHIGESSSCQTPMPEAQSMPPTSSSTAASTSSSTAAGPSLPPASSKALVHTSRPGLGEAGKKYLVRANHFLVQVKNNNISQYEIKIHEEVKSKKLSRNLKKKLFEHFGASHLGNRKAAYDGRSILYTAESLPFQSNEFTLNLPDRNGQDKIYTVSIRFTKALDLYNLQQFLSTRQLECPYDILAALDVVLSESPSNSHLTISRSFFSHEINGSKDPPRGLEYWKGFFQSLRPTQMGLSLNVDAQATPLYKPINLLTFIQEYLNKNPITPNIMRQQHSRIEWVLKGVRVETTHMPNMCRRYKITGITTESAYGLFFTLDGTPTSVSNYFTDRYPNATIDFSLPCIKAGSDDNPKYLPIEVCKIMDQHRYVKKLDPDQLKQITERIGVRPSNRERNILEMVLRNDYNSDKYVKEFGISVEPELVKLEARLLPAPTLMYNESGQQRTCEPRYGQWNISRKRMFDGGAVDTWACINFSHITDQSVDAFLEVLVSTCNSIGMDFRWDPVVGGSYSHPPRKIEGSLRKLHSDSIEHLKWQNRNHKQLQLLIVILPEDVKGSYGLIKTICETELGVVTQCCQPQHLQYSRGPYFVNLALKINVKVSGCNTILCRNPLMIPGKPTIIFGADVTHPSPGDDSPSIAAVVASMDWPDVKKYKAVVSAQPRGQEIINDLFNITTNSMGMIWELLRAFYRSTNQKPDRIIFYRDGVSEGQFQDVLSFEINAIRKACERIDQTYHPSITFIVVQKRHHTRLFPVGNTDDKTGNIYAGTVVDTRICHPTDFDFYLCSHAGIKGTSRPAHYVVLRDENNFSADELQGFTNDLCYTYARCTRSVSVVPPALYAHLAAFRARYYMEVSRQKDPNSTTVPRIKEKVSNVMFFC